MRTLVTSNTNTPAPNRRESSLPPGHVDNFPRERNQSTLDSVLRGPTLSQGTPRQRPPLPESTPSSSSSYRPIPAQSASSRPFVVTAARAVSSSLPYPRPPHQTSRRNGDAIIDDSGLPSGSRVRHRHRSRRSRPRQRIGHHRSSHLSPSSSHSDEMDELLSDHSMSGNDTLADDGASLPGLSEGTVDDEFNLNDLDLNQLTQPISAEEQQRAVNRSLLTSTFESKILECDRPFRLPVEVDEDAVHALLESKRNKLRPGESYDRCYMCEADEKDAHYIRLLSMGRHEITFRSMEIVCRNISSYFNTHIRPTVKYRWPWMSVVSHFKEHLPELIWIQKASINRWSNICDQLARGLVNVDPNNTNVRFIKEKFNMYCAAEKQLHAACARAKWLMRQDIRNK
jgi:hypothetical protein